MFSFSKTFFLLAACMLVSSAPVPNDAKRDLSLPAGFKSSEKELVNLDVSNFKRLNAGAAAEGSALLSNPLETDIFKRQDDGGLVIPPGFKPLPVESKQLLHLDTSNFKRQDDGGLVIPPGFKPLSVSSKQFVHLDTSNFKRQDDGGLVLPPDFKPLPVEGKQLLHLDTSNF